MSSGILASLSAELAGAVESAAPSVVRVDDGTRLTATGVIWSEDGLIVTTSHGVERDEELAVEREDGARLPAALVGRDPDTDIALLRVQASGLPAIQAAEEAEARIGNLALALGRPGSSGLQATLGIISARRESQTHGQPGYILHTDAVLYPGFSGGPLVSVGGRMAGLTNRMFGRGAGVALGVPVVAEIVRLLAEHGHARRGYLGVRMQGVALPKGLHESLGQARGLLIVQVEADSPAEQAGLLLGDTLLRINDRPLDDVDDLRHSLRARETVTLRVLRGGEPRELSVTLAAGE